MKNKERLLYDLSTERSELRFKISSLAFFIKVSPDYKKLTTYHRSLLCEQLTLMEHYEEILEYRIEDIKRGENNG